MNTFEFIVTLETLLVSSIFKPSDLLLGAIFDIIRFKNVMLVLVCIFSRIVDAHTLEKFLQIIFFEFWAQHAKTLSCMTHQPTKMACMLISKA